MKKHMEKDINNMTFKKIGLEINKSINVINIDIFNEEYNLVLDVKQLEKDLNIGKQALTVDYDFNGISKHTILTWKGIELIKCDKGWSVNGYKYNDLHKTINLRLIDVLWKNLLGGPK